MIARTVVDGITGYVVIPSSHYLYKRVGLSIDFWHPALICILMGILRAVSPYAASFQGSRLGRVLTRQFFRDARHNWLPIQRAQDLNLMSDDCCEGDEISENADLAKLAKTVAKALGKSQSLGVDGMMDQNENLAAEGFYQVGSGSGGYAVYECHRVIKSGAREDDLQTILLHLTPYGPSLLDVMPRYMVLEKEDAQDRRGQWSEYIASKRWQGPSVVEGYAYQGAFFSPFHFAEMKERYEKQLIAYDAACAVMAKARTGRKAGPPTDLPSLKVFLANGKRPRKRKKNEREYNSLQKDVSRVARKLKSMMSTGKKGCSAPHGVILYFEGLDCSGKSSTGGLIEQALVQAGFDVDMRQYNRPPTEEQKRQPWMNRFALPDMSPIADGGENEEISGNKPAGGDCPGHRHSAMVWDRGPAGDFVYGALAQASTSEKNDRYREFMQFDADCMKKKILFVKLMFVTNRDSIAGTLGKRLAQRKMAQDLRTWLKASYADVPGTSDVPMEGLDMIDMHIDPTDFVAFNRYQHNLRVFMNFALNTDTDANPWLVVNTTDRLAARRQLLRVFEAQIDSFARAQQPGSRSWCSRLLCPTGAGPEQQDTPGITMAQMVDRKINKGLSLGTVTSLMGLLILVFYYCEQTTFGDNLNILLRRFYGDEETSVLTFPTVVP
jgi:polyphosphate kinase 2 (PPK2 family)